MRIIKVLTACQVIVSAVFIAVVVTDPNTTRDAVLITLYVVMFSICRYLLWRFANKAVK